MKFWRIVTRAETTRYTRGGSIRLYLECGHEAVRKLSEGYPRRIACKDCACRSNGSISTRYCVALGTKTVETWDNLKRWPRRKDFPMTAAEKKEWGDVVRPSREQPRPPRPQ